MEVVLLQSRMRSLRGHISFNGNNNWVPEGIAAFL